MTDPDRFWPRVVARLRGRADGPMLIVLGGIHGNEPAGLHAIEPLLEPPGLALARGDLVVLSGNRGALAEGVRYLERDLNRGWSETSLENLPIPLQARFSKAKASWLVPPSLLPAPSAMEDTVGVTSVRVTVASPCP